MAVTTLGKAKTICSETSMLYKSKRHFINEILNKCAETDLKSRPPRQQTAQGEPGLQTSSPRYSVGPLGPRRPERHMRLSLPGFEGGALTDRIPSSHSTAGLFWSLPCLQEQSPAVHLLLSFAFLSSELIPFAAPQGPRVCSLLGSPRAHALPSSLCSYK